jgi:hypothetical protein
MAASDTPDAADTILAALLARFDQLEQRIDSKLADFTSTVNEVQTRLASLDSNTDKPTSVPTDTPTPDVRGRRVKPSVLLATQANIDTDKAADADPLFGFDDVYGDNSDAEAAVPSHRTPSRRSTIFGRLTERSERDAVQLVVQGQQPPHEHIKLEHLTIGTFYKFFEQITGYHTAHRIKLKPAARVLDPTKKRVMAHHALSEEEFYSLEAPELYDKMRVMILPRSKLDFTSKLEKYATFDLPTHYKPSAMDFKLMYDALLAYRDRFRKIVELMSDDLGTNVPACDNKEGGLIRSFLSKVPFEYGKRVYQNMGEKKFPNIYKFLKAFYERVQLHWRSFDDNLELRQSFGGTEWMAKKFSSAHNNIDLDTDYEDAAADSRSARDVSGDSDFDEDYDQLAAMQEPPPKDPQVCLTKVQFGTCTKTNCKYTHREDLISKTRSKMIERMQKLSPAPHKLTVLQRQPVEDSLSHMALSEAMPAAPVRDDQLEGAMEELFLANIPSHFFVRSVHRTGSITVDSAVLPVAAALFDTGATTASYLSAEYVEKHREALGPYLQPARGAVRLAAHDHVVHITHAARLSVSFTDPHGVIHSAEVRFIVLPGSSNEMVIGLPAIVAHFGVLFMSMLKHAMEEYAEGPSHQLDAVLQLSEPTADPAPEYSLHPRASELRSPWTLPPDADAPEDLEAGLPCAFPDVLHFMEMTYDEAVQEFLSLIESHVSPDFRAATQVAQLLRSKGVHAFVPTNWEGIKGIEPLELKWKVGFPERLKPAPRHINPRLLQRAHDEFKRLGGYMYTPSSSPVASPIVLASKATPPYVRFCGDYVKINTFIENGHYPIPHVQHSLEKICGYKVFLDIDLVNAFHQIPLAPLTSARLSLQTPWGQVAPRFMPEGISPGSFELQKAVDTIFGDFSEWTIAIFDNLLVLAHDYDDAHRKLELIIDRCITYNLYLKFAKTWLGFSKVHFFGYDCEYGRYGLSEERKSAITALPPPASLKQMQSFLGAALYFKSFVANFSILAAPLSDMTKQGFQWPAVWTDERLAAFTAFKEALLHSLTVYYPDYSLPWVLRTDASTRGVGMALFQIYRPTPDSEPEYQVILIDSQKFSDQATRWDTYSQEAYAVYFGVKKAAYYLRGKPFVIETDHANLQWMETSEVPKVVRWRVYLQSFTFSLRHIPGKQNLLADWLSRLHEDPADAHPLQIAKFDTPQLDPELERMFREALAHPSPVAEPAAPPAQSTPTDAVTPAPPSNAAPLTPETLFQQVHGGRMGHHGARKTLKMLHEYFPGHGLSERCVSELIERCAVCQKDRLGMADALKPIYRSLKPDHKRKMVGVDTLTVTPPDKWGNQYITVVVVHATKLVGLYPSQHKGAQDTALALFRFFSQYGVYEDLISDPGSDLTSEVVKQLTAWYGIRHIFSLVDRHESNGVEGTNKSILRHLRALVADERVADRWSDPTVLCLVQYILNSQVSHETGIVPFHAHFGSDDATYFRLPDALAAAETTQTFVKLLDENLRTLWDISKQFQHSLKLKRAAGQDLDKQNKYQPGDLVLFQRDLQAPAPSKLALRYMGPYEVISHVKNDVTCRHLCVKTTHTFHVERLKMFFGSREDAERVARLDHDQFEVDSILYWRGSPDVRTSMEFFIRFADGEQKWVTWSKDLFDSIPYENFCRSQPPLFPLIFTVAEAKRRIAEINAKPITEVQPGDKVFVDLRSRGNAWYQGLGLPRCDELTYVLPCKYGPFYGRNERKIRLFFELTKEDFPVDHYFVQAYGSCKTFDAERMVLVTPALCRKYPGLMP